MATPKTWPEVAAQVASLHPDGAAVAALAEAAGLDPDDLGMIGMDVDGEHSLALVFGAPIAIGRKQAHSSVDISALQYRGEIGQPGTGKLVGRGRKVSHQRAPWGDFVLLGQQEMGLYMISESVMKRDRENP